MEYEKLERIYEQVLSLKFKDLDKAIDKAKTEDEKEFYLDLYNYKLARRQGKGIRQKGVRV